MVTIPKIVPRSERRRVSKLLEEDRLKRKRMELRRFRFLRGAGIVNESEHLADSISKVKKIGTDGADAMGRLEEARKQLVKGKLPTMTPLLPLLFNLNGKPYHLRDHFPFEPFYHTRLCRKLLWKTGRQVAKSTNQAAQGVLQSNLLPYFNTLFVTPQFELIRRFSSNYVQPFIMESPIRPLFLDTSCTNSVLQRSFRNKSIMYFSFAMLDCDRTRGLNCGKVSYDEVQDMDPSFIPIIREVMSASPYGLEQYTGTPKTLEGTIQVLWEDSSQAEWVTKCGACNYFNFPSLERDLEKMLGPKVVTREISEAHPAVVCAKCGKPINPRDGYWVHGKPDLRFEFSGYHVPQLIMPMHYADAEKWAILQGKRMGFGRTPYNVFLNEVCGESADMGAKLLTVTDLKRAAVLPWDNELAQAMSQIGNYTQRIISVDWGGGGEDEISFTTIAILGMKPNGEIDVLYGWRSLTPNAPIQEAIQVLHLMKHFRCSHLVHDFAGAGNLREAIIAQSGLPENRIIPVAYARVNVGPMMAWKDFNENTGKRGYHILDKARSLQYTCELIKQRYIKFFRYDHHGPDNPGLLHDFLSLVEDKVDSRHGMDLFTIIRNQKAGPDDFAQAVNMGACALFHARDHWPDIAQHIGLEIDPDILNMIAPLGETLWDDWP